MDDCELLDFYNILRTALVHITDIHILYDGFCTLNSIRLIYVMVAGLGRIKLDSNIYVILFYVITRVGHTFIRFCITLGIGHAYKFQ